MGCFKPHYHIRLTRKAKLDLGVWLDFLTGDYLQLYTDAAGGIGYEAICGLEWFYGVWPVEWHCYCCFGTVYNSGNSTRVGFCFS